MQKSVFLDRDGVLNRNIMRDGKPRPPSNVSELEILPGARVACDLLKKAGFSLIVVTNQPDVVRGLLTRESVEVVNNALLKELPLDGIRVCYHDDKDHCLCRKPLPGMILDAAKERSIDVASSFLVGDRWKDIEAGRRAGCKTVLIEYPYSELERTFADHKAVSLREAVDWILSFARARMGGI